MQKYLNTLGVVPNEMIKDNSRYVYDTFNSKVKLENHAVSTEQQGGGYAVGVNIDSSEYAIEICRNYITMAKMRADDVYAVYIQRQENDESYTSTTFWFGNKLSNKANRLKDMDRTKMNTACRVCDETKSCFIFILVGYNMK